MSLLPQTLLLTPVSRNPLTLAADTIRTLEQSPRTEAPKWIAQASSHAPATPHVSIVIVTYNGLEFTRMCLQSLFQNTSPRGLEVIVVDNHSGDGTVEYLREAERRIPQLRAIYNSANLGFAPANNQGLAVARGAFLVLLNNDTILSPGSLARLLDHLSDAKIGLVGPVTNRIGNEAEIDTSYQTYGELERFAAQRAARHWGRCWDIPMLCMYCLAMRRDVFERLGPLDERYQVGMMEDDDYSLRARHAGWRVVCAEDAFVHHFGGASFGRLTPRGEYSRLLEANRRRFEQKWNRPWKPHHRRRSLAYLDTIDRIHSIVGDAIPAHATVAVVSRGDNLLLELDSRPARHFPQDDGGGYAGCYPRDGSEAIAQLEKVKSQGVEYLLFPNSSHWWFEHYPVFHQHLAATGTTVWGDDSCTIFRL